LQRCQGHDQQAIKTGKLSATRREDGSWCIDGAELARYVDANSHRFRPETVDDPVAGEQLETIPELRARAELAEQRLSDLRSALDDMKVQRDKWETVATRLSLPAPKPAQPVEQPQTWWRWLRSTG
jgi:hypothetical protein